MRKIKDLTGKKFGKLVVIKQADKIKNRIAWTCKCSCGNEKIVPSTHLISKHTKSCGCLKKIGNAKTHGLSNHPAYAVHTDMMTRCYNKNYAGYHNYGGRGITVCKKWKNNRELFIKWAIKNGYKKSLAIDRKNTNGNYCPSNCRFVTQRKNNINRRLFKNSKSGYVGVNASGAKWAARIRIEGDYVWIGTYTTPEEAALARNLYIKTNKLYDYAQAVIK